MPSLPPVHRPYAGKPSRSPDQQHDRRRGSARARGYDARWDRAASLHLRLHPLCVGCQAIGMIVEADLVDHVEPHKGDMVVFWDTDRWQSACRWHHDVVKQRLEKMLAKGLIRKEDLWLSSSTAIDLTNSMRGHR